MKLGNAPHRLLPSLTAALLLTALITGAQALVRINEVSDKGTSSGLCDVGDWIEIYNPGPDPINLAGYALHDDRGPADPEAFVFPDDESATVMGGEFLVMCAGADPDVNFNGSEMTVPFGIGGTDQVTLRDPSGIVLSSTGSSMDGSGDEGITLAYDDATSSYVYTATPTPGGANIITEILTPEEYKASLAARNDLGTEFFDMDVNGIPVENGFAPVVDLRLILDPPDKVKISGPERGHEVYSPLRSATVTALDDPETVLAAMPSGGRIRPKGQSTMYLGVCANRTTPYQIDWTSPDDPDQHLFGASKIYLRTAYADPSYVREWVAHRMLARFGLPHLRSRTVRLLINDEVYGLYTLMEAPDQEYVFARSFPDFDLENYGLYKIKTQSISCGSFEEEALERARARINETATPPYSFERGEHRPPIPVLGDEAMCLGPFIQNLATVERSDVELAYVRSGEGKCGEFLVGAGLVDRDLGDKSQDELAAAFVDAHLADNTCADAYCSNSDLMNDVDVNNWIRNLASKAVLLNQDGPLGNGNNWYMAHTGDGLWKIVQYDHNNIMSFLGALLCDSSGSCLPNLMKWSIVRPTCHAVESNQVAGPILVDEGLRALYVEAVREFVNDVLLNEELLRQIEDQLVAIRDLLPQDPWSDFAPLFDDLELAPGGDWLHVLPFPGGPFPDGLPYVAFLPALRARGSEIRRQLSAIDGGTYPRKFDEYNPGEACVDWTTTSPPDFACHNNCYYEACSTTGVTMQAFCDPESGTCLKGGIDFDCVGVPDGEPVPGTSVEEGPPTFCLTTDESFPIKVTPCPPYVEDDDGGAEAADGGGGGDDGDGGGSTVLDDGTSSSSSSSRPVLPLLVIGVALLSLHR